MNPTWTQFNAKGLLLAGQGQWVEATRAFEEALAALQAEDASGVVTPVAHDDIRARLLLNIGQCHFHTGLINESRQFAERSCALRVALYGEDSLVVARTRGDLAVILAASGHTEEAMSLLDRAVSAVERKRGEASAHLLPLLTNAARLLARVAPDRAQPYVARLNALQFAQKLADDAEIFPPTEVPAHSFAEAPLSSGSDDHLLRAAIAQTADLLRSTPAANVAVGMWADSDLAKAADEADGVDASETDEVFAGVDAVDEAEAINAVAVVDAVDGAEAINAVAVVDAVDEAASDNINVAWEYEVPPAVVPPPVVPTPVVPPEELRVSVQRDELDDLIFDLVEPPPPTLSELPKPASDPSQTAKPNPLGFQVEYGIPSQLHESFANPTAPLPTNPKGDAIPESEFAAPPQANRQGVRAVGGVRRGSTQVVAVNRLWMIGASVAAFGGGIAAVLLYRYFNQLAR